MQKQMCAQSANPAACEERVGRLKDAHTKARQACEGKKADEARECMRREMCAQSKDPAKCEAEVSQRAARRAELREACKGKTGDELVSCIREHRGQK
jgi:Spy/CpxP family protein refolding chaperone